MVGRHSLEVNILGSNPSPATKFYRQFLYSIYLN